MDLAGGRKTPALQELQPLSIPGALAIPQSGQFWVKKHSSRQNFENGGQVPFGQKPDSESGPFRYCRWIVPLMSVVSCISSVLHHVYDMHDTLCARFGLFIIPAVFFSEVSPFITSSRIIGPLKPVPDPERNWQNFHISHVALCSTVRIEFQKFEESN